MNQTIITIMKKELSRFFGDKRMVMSIILPGVLIFLMYSFMGDALSAQLEVDDDRDIRIEAVNLPSSIEQMAEESDMEIQSVSQEQEKKGREKVTAQDLELCVVFEEDFDEKVAAYDISSGEKAPAVSVYYNAASTESTAAYEMVTSLLEGYEGMLCNKFDVNPGEEEYNLATEKDTVGSMFASMLPMLLMMFLYSGCVSIAPESIAGEKERGTIATLLITPVRRGDIAIGKIMALSLLALLSGASSTIGTILSLPHLMQAGDDINTNVYQWQDYLLLAVIILSTVLVIITVMSIISAFAKTVKEAQTYVTPLMVLVMLAGITAMFGDGSKTEWQYYLIPLYNSVQSMLSIFAFEAVPLHIIATVGMNIAVTGAGVFVLTRMFHSEKVIFSR